MPIILPSVPIDSDPMLARFFLPYQRNWIQAEDALHAQGVPQVFALAEKSVRIGWTFADAFKNVRKRLRSRKRDYLFATKDFASALEYMKLCYDFADVLDFTRAVLSHGEEYLDVPRLTATGKLSGFTDQIKIGMIKFDNGSRIIAFSSNPRAMSVHAGDVGLDEFAKHPDARTLWETAQGRVTWGYDMAVWSAHNGEDTLFNEFALEARAKFQLSTPCSSRREEALISSESPCSSRGNEAQISQTNPAEILPSQTNVPPLPFIRGPHSAERSTNLGHPSRGGVGNSLGRGEGSLSAELRSSQDPESSIKNLETNPPIQKATSPWNLYYRVTISDAVDQGLLKVINRVQKTTFNPAQFVADCRARARDEEVFQQAYLCNPVGASTSHIVDWSSIELCRHDYECIRLHLEHDAIIREFGPYRPDYELNRHHEIADFLRSKFRPIFQTKSRWRLGFDVAASGSGSLAVIYIDERKGDEAWLRALLTCRTEDWNFLSTTLHVFLHEARSIAAAGDASGLGRQICWDAGKRFPGRFTSVNFSSKKHDLGFGLMNELASGQKRFPRSEQDIAADYFALRKQFAGSRWAFTETKNALNPHSHCDIAWAGALATEAHREHPCTIFAMVG